MLKIRDYYFMVDFRRPGHKCGLDHNPSKNSGIILVLHDNTCSCKYNNYTHDYKR